MELELELLLFPPLLLLLLSIMYVGDPEGTYAGAFGDREGVSDGGSEVFEVEEVSDDDETRPAVVVVELIVLVIPIGGSGGCGCMPPIITAPFSSIAAEEEEEAAAAAAEDDDDNVALLLPLVLLLPITTGRGSPMPLVAATAFIASDNEAAVIDGPCKCAIDDCCCCCCSCSC